MQCVLSVIKFSEADLLSVYVLYHCKIWCIILLALAGNKAISLLRRSRGRIDIVLVSESLKNKLQRTFKLHCIDP